MRDSFYNSLDLNDGKCFRAIRLHKGKVSTPTSTLTFNEVTYEDHSLPTGWATYFQHLAEPDWCSFTATNISHVESRFLEVLKNCSQSQEIFDIQPEMVAAAIKSLSKGKASGPDALSPEHLLNSPIVEMSNLLAPIFSAML